MGSLRPEDIASYVFCPRLYSRDGQDKIAKPLTFYEAAMRDAFIEGEEAAVLKDSLVDSRKLTRAWDNIWFPTAAKRGISMKKAGDLTLKATIKFADYCKYDISDYTFPTAGTNINATFTVGTHNITASADLLKIDMTTKKKTTVIVNFTNRKLSLSEHTFDTMVRTTAYAFYRNKNDYVTHVNVNIDEKLEKLEITTSNFSPKDMDEIRKMIYHIERGIRNKAFYHNSYMCKGCMQCPNSN